MRDEAHPASVREPRPGLFEREGVEIPGERRMVGGGLLLYHFPLARWFRDAATIMDHAGSFQRYSRFGIQMVNTDTVFPQRIAELDFQLVIVHYSIFGPGFYQLSEDHLDWLRSSKGYKVLLPQDENRYCGQRFWFCDEVAFDVIYTLLPPSEFEEVYGAHTKVPRIRTTLPGYASEQMVENADRLSRPHEERPIDVGYRARGIPAHSGRGAQEKQEIGRRFFERAKGLDLELDIKVEEEDRLYGKHWPRFISRCKAVLGVESGVSIFDVDDRVIDEYERLLARNGSVSVDDLSTGAEAEDRIFYRTISPRHFEAAAMRTCQILYEGRYSGVLEPMRHYLPLRKDFSNFDEVIRLFRDPEVRREVTDTAHRELIESGRYGYRRFIEDFDRDMIEDGLNPGATTEDIVTMRRAINRGRRWRKLKTQLRWTYYRYLAPDPFRVLYYKVRMPIRAMRHRLAGVLHRAVGLVRRRG